MKILKRIDATVSCDVAFLLVVDAKDDLKKIEKKIADYLDENWDEFATEDTLSASLGNVTGGLERALGGNESVYTWNGEELLEVCSDDEVKEFMEENAKEEAEKEAQLKQLTLGVL